MNLADPSLITALDKGQALESLKSLPNQIDQAWKEASEIKFPSEYKSAKNIVIAGMGGSIYGGRIVKSLYDTAANSKVPICIANGYSLPGFVDKNTLVILSSYSGTTEETLECGKQAIEKGALITGVTSGGLLGSFLTEKNLPAYIFDPQYNPSSQPRMGGGYMIIGLIAILAKLGYIPVGEEEIKNIVSFLKKKSDALLPDVNSNSNKAKQIALKYKDRIPVTIAADFLEGAAHAIRNPIHETAKQFGLYFTIPELNHHLLEGLKFPEKAHQLLYFVFIESALYHERNQKRLTLTKDIVAKNDYETLSLRLEAPSALAQTMELIQLGSWISFYLAILNGIDPSPVPWVDYFKKNLS
ncbi:hypothetical protein A2773_02960 [Candidatus Gottesmanbacteria bacterium RIFCSPHIGHO2_01_FULL_39_10]|uniref:SIS domain-containing protein n=1 Tax=Candidatus Gottesmanbacteria bacterium RIFCSPHIGHO2_01_FULL_39_10 TaxID=1798375 RepID=A0A1F5ZQI5_9BACT|nr:MAG: hypothetical protein A2773_02960 [Candidatus Gottesmanbacteria bacterium RIFCSPHIGHO2_01_FULL_39_10]